ncbi:MAG: Holliday junction branch migration protein RuvA [Candidatus Kryptoniota bacterium]
MIYRINGILVEKNPASVIVKVGGVDLELMIPFSTYDKLGSVGENVSLFTILQIREENINLFGFATPEEKRLFKLLIGVNGIGPRTALSLLSSASVDDISRFVIGGDASALTAIPGIGRKTAERVIIELRDKMEKVMPAAIQGEDQITVKEDVRNEAMDALLILGYSRSQSEKAIRAAINKSPSVQSSAEALVRAALKEFR